MFLCLFILALPVRHPHRLILYNKAKGVPMSIWDERSLFIRSDVIFLTKEEMARRPFSESRKVRFRFPEGMF